MVHTNGLLGWYQRVFLHGKFWQIFLALKKSMDDCLSVANGDSDFENTCLNVLFNSDYFWSWGTVRMLKTWFIKWVIKICYTEILTKFISFAIKFLSNSFQWSRWWVILMRKRRWIQRRMLWSHVRTWWHRWSHWRCSSRPLRSHYWCSVTWITWRDDTRPIVIAWNVS